jgi:hypothetical protein
MDPSYERERSCTQTPTYLQKSTIGKKWLRLKEGPRWILETGKADGQRPPTELQQIAG